MTTEEVVRRVVETRAPEFRKRERRQKWWRIYCNIFGHRYYPVRSPVTWELYNPRCLRCNWHIVPDKNY